MPKIEVTTAQFFYLTRAVSRDLETLEEMAPWEIDDNQDKHEDEIRLCKALAKLLGRVEQTQVITH